MSDTNRTPDSRDRDPDPDGAALDELREAFGVEAPPSDRGDDADDADDATAAADSDPVEREDGDHEPSPPPVIRIDDLDGDADPIVPAGDERLVISIDADDLPDPVYVEGSLESGGSGSIVFIEDAPDSELLTPESDRDLRRGIEPRMRERRLAVKRAQGRKRLKWVIALVVVLLIGVGVLATLGSSLFAVRADQVSITGNVYTDRERLQAVVDDLVGTPVLRVDTQAAEAELESIPWVEHAKVTTDFPHAVSIDLSERRAVATYQGPDGRFRVLDPEGRVLDVLDQWPFAYVLLSGPDPVDLEPAEFAPQGYKAAAELADNLTGSVRGQVERIDVTANGSRLSMWLDDGTEVRFGEARELFVKLVRLETVLMVNPQRAPGAIDVSTQETTSPTPTLAPP
jgi:cell division protein FtsQ